MKTVKSICALLIVAMCSCSEKAANVDENAAQTEVNAQEPLPVIEE